jgi:hypothetical protein
VFEHNKLDAAVRRLQQRYVRLQWRAVGLDVCLGLALAGLLATVVISLAGWSVSRLAVYGVMLAGAGLIFAGLAWRVHVSELAVLQCADRVLRLQERLSTAYEYLHQGPGNVFVPGLVAEAERLAPQVEPQLVFPTRWPRRIWAIPVLLVAIVGLARLEIAPLQFEAVAPHKVTQEVAHEGQRLEHWGRRLEELAKQQRLDRSLILARYMQNLGGEKSQAAERISTLSQYLHRMQEELRERALMSEAGAMMARDVLVSGKSVKQELQNILQLLQRDDLPREMATVAEQGVLRLGQRLGQNPALEQLVQNLRAGNVKAARQLLQDIIQRQQMAEEMEHLERARRALQYSSRELQGGEPSQAPTTRSPEPGDRLSSGTPLDFDGEGMGEDMPSLEDFASPGFDEGFGAVRSTRQGPAQRLRESEQSPSQVQVKSSEGPMRLGYVRSLPVQNKAHEPIEQVVVQYQHAAEEVLSQEKIPRSYREQIKQYFLAIGMMPENQQ